MTFDDLVLISVRFFHKSKNNDECKQQTNDGQYREDRSLMFDRLKKHNGNVVNLNYLIYVN